MKTIFTFISTIMETINSYESFVFKTSDNLYIQDNECEYNSDGIYINNGNVISNVKFENFIIDSDLDNITFDNCSFKNIYFNCKYVKNVLFKECIFSTLKAFGRFSSVVFLECEINESFFYSVDFTMTNFDNTFIFKTSISYSSDRLIFRNSELQSCYFSQSMTSNLSSNSVHLESSEINNCDFKIMNLDNYRISNCSLSNNSFQSSKISSAMFSNNTKTIYEQYSQIDLSTLNWSEKLSADVLKNIFSIHNSDIQLHVKDSFKEIKYQSVFISFSFINDGFARSLSQKLVDTGVTTWFWPEDAPGGKRTRDIMYKGIKDNDRVIFICSVDSLKSEACHYELSEARKKEGKLWKDVLFPVRIDNSVFDEEFIKNIRKYKKEFADEWIANIEWLKEYNILDFSEYCKSDFNQDDFSKAIDNLVKDLRKPIEKE